MHSTDRNFGKMTLGNNRRGPSHRIIAFNLLILIDFLEAEYAKFNEELHHQLGSGLIDYPHLWAIFSPSTILSSRTGDSPEIPTISIVT
ncbi:hypothetical protein J3F83DRAFT_648740 [Trichoderma novae-zelandiae]